MCFMRRWQVLVSADIYVTCGDYPPTEPATVHFHLGALRRELSIPGCFVWLKRDMRAGLISLIWMYTASAGPCASPFLDSQPYLLALVSW